MSATVEIPPEAIAAAWETIRRHQPAGRVLGSPGPAFKEAMQAALAVMELPSAEQNAREAGRLAGTMIACAEELERVAEIGGESAMRHEMRTSARLLRAEAAAAGITGDGWKQ